MANIRRYLQSTMRKRASPGFFFRSLGLLTHIQPECSAHLVSISQMFRRFKHLFKRTCDIMCRAEKTTCVGYISIYLNSYWHVTIRIVGPIIRLLLLMCLNRLANAQMHRFVRTQYTRMQVLALAK